MAVSSKLLPVLLAVLALASLAGAVTLEALHLDATNAWGAFVSFSSVFVGVHIPVPVPAAVVAAPVVAVAPAAGTTTGT